MKALEILKTYTGMTMKQFHQLPREQSMDEGIARMWFRKAYIYSEQRLLENATPQEATAHINKNNINPLFINEICIIGEIMYHARLQAAAV